MCQAKEGEVGIVWLVLENIYIYIFLNLSYSMMGPKQKLYLFKKTYGL